MKVQDLFNRLLEDGLDRHHFTVDTHPALPLHWTGENLICRLEQRPMDLVQIGIYMAFHGFEETDLKAGTYHLDADVVDLERTDNAWRVALYIRDRDGQLTNRQSDRLRIHNLPIQIARPGSQERFTSKVLDLSREGLGIRRGMELELGEVIEISGLAEATGVAFGASVAFEVRSLPNSNVAGLLLSGDASGVNHAALLGLFMQLKQTQRFWQSLLDNVRSSLGLSIPRGAHMSAEFACRQLRERKVPRAILINDAEFEAVSESLFFLGTLNRVTEELEGLAEEKKRLEAKAPEKKDYLRAFLNRLEH